MELAGDAPARNYSCAYINPLIPNAGIAINILDDVLREFYHGVYDTLAGSVAHLKGFSTSPELFRSPRARYTHS